MYQGGQQVELLWLFLSTGQFGHRRTSAKFVRRTFSDKSSPCLQGQGRCPSALLFGAGQGQEKTSAMPSIADDLRARARRRATWGTMTKILAVEYLDEEATPKKDRPRCGARTRQGAHCQAPVVWDRETDRPKNGRCRMHGGMSTGPRTEGGRSGSLLALQKGHRAWRARNLKPGPKPR